MRIELLDKLAGQGNMFTFEEAKEAMGADPSVVRVTLSRLEKRGWIERIERGKYMIVPLGAKKGQYTLHEFVIASSLVSPYCISYWSALHFYGLTEQIPSTVFVQTTSRKKRQSLEIFGVRYRIIRVGERKFFGERTEWIEGTAVQISDLEKTIVDCLDKPQHCGGVAEAAKALSNPDIDLDRLASYAGRIGNSGVVRRLGYLAELKGLPIELPSIDPSNYLMLDPTMPHEGKRNARWRLIVNLDEKMLEGQE